MATSQHQTGTVVISYFPDGEAAHRAINALIDEGFAASEIGAAFHVTEQGALRTNQEAQRAPNVGGSLREELGTTISTGSARSSTTLGSATSDTTAVQPGALIGGSGTPFGGAARPGPIPGSSLANTGLPSELESSLPHDSDVREGEHGGSSAGQSSTAGTTHRSYTPPAHVEHTSHQHEGILDRLKHVFGMHESHTKHADTLAHEIKKDSKEFGTGEGDLHLNAPQGVSGSVSGAGVGSASSRGLQYSHSGFENSFKGYGAHPEHARHVSQQLGHGGAVVTVHAALRAIEAERILESLGGEVRFAGEGAATTPGEGLVEVFGTVQRDYSGYNA